MHIHTHTHDRIYTYTTTQLFLLLTQLFQKQKLRQSTVPTSAQKFCP
jgi:hypothetical protein